MKYNRNAFTQSLMPLFTIIVAIICLFFGLAWQKEYNDQMDQDDGVFSNREDHEDGVFSFTICELDGSRRTYLLLKYSVPLPQAEVGAALDANQRHLVREPEVTPLFLDAYSRVESKRQDICPHGQRVGPSTCLLCDSGSVIGVFECATDPVRNSYLVVRRR